MTTFRERPNGAFAGGADEPPVSLSLVIPAYNEAARLGRSLESIRDYAERAGATWEVIVVDDGSRDGTGDLARRFEPGPLRLRVLSIS